MKLSYNQATASLCSSLEKDLICCEKSGFDYIEIRGDMLLDYLQDHAAEELVEFFQKSHIKPHAFNALYTYADMFHPTRKNIARDRELMAFLISCCQVGEKIGSHYFIVVPDIGDNANEVDYPDSYDKIIEDNVRILTKLSAIAKGYGMNLCFEPVGSRGCAVKTFEHALEIVTSVNRQNVGLVLDSFNLYLHNRLNDFSNFKTIPLEKIFAVHINNCDDLPLGILDHCHRRFVNLGAINLDNYLSSLKSTGYDGMISIETFRPEYWESTPELVIPEAYETTKKLIDRY